MSDTRGQHIVPRFYLHRFANKDGKLWCWDGHLKKIFAADPAKLGKERDAFSIPHEEGRDDSFDEINSNVEDSCAPLVGGISRHPLDADTIKAIWALTANLLLRSRRHRDSFAQSNEKIAKLAERIPTPLPESEGERKLFELLGFDQWDGKESARAIRRAAALFYPVSQVLLKDICTHLEVRKFDVLQTTGGCHFITSDDPAIIVVDGDVAQTHPPSALLENPDATVILPIDGSHACQWKTNSNFERETLEAEQVSEINSMLLDSAYRQIYSGSKELIEGCLARREEGTV